ncbi:hypothetical protein, partial [Pseudomonas proteolytica]|uniref:hypothetical protein n=1 Tax=Pseudomonas proteolytica TaxID=219574 RepID=UPI001CA3B8A2
PKPAAAVYLVQRIRLIGAASQPSAGDAAFRQARSPQLRYLPGFRRCGKIVLIPMAIAGKPAPTFDRIPKMELGQVWELACLRRGRKDQPKNSIRP